MSVAARDWQCLQSSTRPGSGFSLLSEAVSPQFKIIPTPVLHQWFVLFIFCFVLGFFVSLLMSYFTARHFICIFIRNSWPYIIEARWVDHVGQQGTSYNKNLFIQAIHLVVHLLMVYCCFFKQLKRLLNYTKRRKLRGKSAYHMAADAISWVSQLNLASALFLYL